MNVPKKKRGGPDDRLDSIADSLPVEITARTRRGRLAPPTALQVWTCSVPDTLSDARLELGATEFEVLLDIVATRLAHEYVARIGSSANASPNREAA